LTRFIFAATVRKFDLEQRQNLTEFGQYAATCLPKYIQKVQITAGDELELLIAPEGICTVLSFLKGHHNAQFTSLVDIAGVDMPTRKYRFEVRTKYKSED
jgi:NADH dehydrogenase (ubiquinone) Fe-S protein 3